MLSNNLILKNIKEFLSSNVYPHLNELDTNTILLKKIFNAFKNQKYFRIYIPKEYGGIALSHNQKIDFQETMGKMGGALAFLQAQCATTCWLIAQSENATLKKSYLTSIANGKLTIGNATSQMKPKSKAIITGHKEQNGYRVSGKVCFATGWKFYDKLLIGFMLDNEREAFAIIPFKSKIINDGKIQVHPILKTISMKSVNTVSLTLENFLIPNEEIILTWPKQTFFNMYRKFPPYAFTLGIASEALCLAKNSQLVISNPKLRAQLSRLKHELDHCRKSIKNPPLEVSVETLSLNIVNTPWICVQFALLVSGGLGLLESHSIQRLYREIVVWLIPRAYSSVIENWVTQILDFENS